MSDPVIAPAHTVPSLPQRTSSPPSLSVPLRIRFFGVPSVEVGGAPLPPLRSRKSLWLLALLALRAGRATSRDTLAGMLWPDTDPATALRNLRPVCSDLRRVLGSESRRLLSPDRGTLLLDLTGADADVAAFDAAIRSGGEAALRHAVAQYAGSLLEGCGEEWVGQERAVRERQCVDALLALGASAARDHSWEAACAYYRRATELELWRDAAWRGWMEALAATGELNEALQTYRAYVELLRADPSAFPEPETTALYRRLRDQARLRSAPPSAPPPSTAPVVAGFLPEPLTALVGREDERSEVCARLRKGRLVTLTGVGGIGKTRLALEVAAELRGAYPGGVWFVALEALSDGKLVPQQLAGVLGCREEARRPLAQSLTDRLRSAQALVVLDNCEHVVAECADLAASLLKECPGLRILATSREALGISGEVVWGVPPLAAPEPEHLPAGRATLQRVLQAYDSVQLFEQRAQAVHASFRITAENALSVAWICAHLQGIPLALELAAARVRSLGAEQIAGRLRADLDLLTGGGRTVQPRQQTLRAALDWSLQLLNEGERRLFARLSVFSGGWTLEAAEAVCSGEGLQRDEVLPMLTALVDRSLVQFQHGPDRYRLLEVVRQYAGEQLAARGASECWREKHRAWCLELAEEASLGLRGPEQEHWLRRLDQEGGNVRAALLGSAAHPTEVSTRTDLHLLGSLWLYWSIRGRYAEARGYQEEVLHRPEAQADTPERMVVLATAGALHQFLGDYDTSRRYSEESLELAKRLQSVAGIARALGNLGEIADFQSDPNRAEGLLRESLRLHRELEMPTGVAWILGALSTTLCMRGEYAEAQRLAQESLEHYQEMGDLRSIAWGVNRLGHLAQMMGDLPGARTLFEDGLVRLRELNDRRGIAWSLAKLASVADDLGDCAGARVLFEESLALLRELGDRRGTGWCQVNLAARDTLEGRFQEAGSRLREALAILEVLRDNNGVAEGLRQWGILSLRQENGPEGARTAARFWGVVTALREAVKVPLPKSVLPEYGRLQDEARQRLGEQRFQEAWDQGCALPWQTAVAEVLQDRMGRAAG